MRITGVRLQDRGGAVATMVAALILFGTVLVGSDRLGFRDVGHFYTPLYGYVGSRSVEAWLPLWNPLDQTGMPLLGETTTAFFYPPRYLLFLLPFSAETALGWYVAGHVVLAAGATSWVARRAGRTAPSAALAGVTYALSGPVLFLYCNPPFLLGAAWLPLAVGPLIETRSSVWLPAVALAMMVLGGDPQTALHAGTVSVVVVAVRSVVSWRETRKRLSAGACEQESGRERRDRWRALLLAPLVAAVLTAPQLSASIDWGRHSGRFHAESLAERFRPPDPGSQRAEAFQFSVPPWRLAEFVTPWAFGRLFPEHHRWGTLIPGDGRIWTPTLYMGLLPFFAVLCSAATRKRGGWDRWLGVAAGTFACAAGSFGLVWWLQTVTGGLRDFDGAIGGPYWVLHQLLPGYAAFRYPAKWLPLVALAVAMVTARWLDRVGARGLDGVGDRGLDGVGDAERREAALRVTRRVIFACGCVLIAGAMIGIGLLWLPGAWQRLGVADQAALPRDRFWGPLDLSRGIRDTVVSCVGSLVVVAAVWFVIRLPSRSHDSLRGELGGWLLVAVTAVELTVTASTYVARVPRGTESRLVTSLQDQAGNAVVAKRWMRTQSGGGWPRSWRVSSDPGRMTDVEASQRAAWFGRWHLADGQAVFNNMTTLRSREIDRFWDTVGEFTTGVDGTEREQRWERIRGWLAIDGVTHTSDETFRIDAVGRSHQLVTIYRWGLPSRRHGYRLHTEWRQAITVGRERDRVMREMLDEAIRLGDGTPARVTGGEAGRGGAAGRGGEVATNRGGRGPNDAAEPGDAESGDAESGDAESGDTIRVARESPEFAEVTVRSRSGGLLRRPTLQDGSWRATIRTGDGEWREAPVHEVDFLVQGVVVPPGTSVVRFRYRPAWLVPSLTVAGVGWATLLATVAIRSTRGGRRKGRTPASTSGHRP